MEQIKELGFAWNQKHCQPPLDDKGVEKQWKCALKFIETSCQYNIDNTRKGIQIVIEIIPKFFSAWDNEKAMM